MVLFRISELKTTSAHPFVYGWARQGYSGCMVLKVPQGGALHKVVQPNYNSNLSNSLAVNRAGCLGLSLGEPKPNLINTIAMTRKMARLTN